MDFIQINIIVDPLSCCNSEDAHKEVLHLFVELKLRFDPFRRVFLLSIFLTEFTSLTISFTLKAFIATDQALSRFDRHLLSDQQVMELIIQDLEPVWTARFHSSDGLFLNVDRWPGITTDPERNVVSFEFASGFTGSLNLQAFPANIKNISIAFNVQLRGQLHTAHIPSTMHCIGIVKSKFDGTVDMRHLPQSLRTLTLKRNEFSGSLDLAALPKSLTSMICDHNNFSGSIRLDALSRSLAILRLDNNFLSGALFFKNIPEKLTKLNLNSNEFEGSFVWATHMPNMRELNVEHNLLYGSAIVEKGSCAVVLMKGNDFEAVFDEDGNLYEDFLEDIQREI